MDDVAPPPSLAGTHTNSNSNLSSKRGSRKVSNEDDVDDEDPMDEDIGTVKEREKKKRYERSKFRLCTGGFRRLASP
jgi:hypothetical protein